MNTLLLPIALLLPWLAGAIALRPARAQLGLTITGWLGYGYFLGAALLTACAFLAALLPWLATTTGLLLCLATLTVAAGYGAKWAARHLPDAALLSLPPTSQGERWLTGLLVILIALHLGFAAFELYWRPVYPWDAWQTWMYTAKTWYFNGGPIDLLSLKHSRPDSINYTVQGHHYPWLVPSQSWWLASVLGAWQENRVTWPALPAAIALGLALWGQAVATTRQRLAGPLTAWLLLTLPLVLTHISLAGYADLWLAGFSGLGLIAIIRGQLEAHRGQLLLGLTALAMGLLVKHDAIIWLTCGLILIGLLRVKQIKLAPLTLIGALLLGCLALGFTDLELQLQFDFARYGQLLWLSDSWHLLWYIVPGALLLALLPRSGARKAAKTLGLLFAILLTSQLLLFGATNAGAWVGTAASRLLLQISPLLIFALACIAGTSTDTKSSRHEWRTIIVALLTGLLGLLLALGAWLLFSANVGGTPAPTKNFKAQDLRVIDGPMRPLYGRLILPQAHEGHAIVSTGPVHVTAEDFDLLDVNIDGTEQSQHTLFWRIATKPSEGFTRSVDLGSGPVVLSDDSNWQGEIIEIGLVLYPNPDQSLRLTELNLEAATPLSLLKVTAADWLTPRLWNQISINRTELSSTQSLPSLTMLAGIWVLFTWLTLRLLTGAAPPLRPLLGAALFAWLVLDARWLHNSYQQALATQDHYTSTTDHEALDIDGDATIIQLADQAHALLGKEPRQVLVVTQSKQHQFATRRLKYGLLPHAAHLHKDRVSRRSAASVDAIIWLTADKPGHQAACPPPLQRVKPVLVTSRGILCTVPPALKELSPKEHKSFTSTP
ncbi:hypothetical protein [Gilvimarinus sp. 1_MG-2023]|uniref:hypothetical protein n=1 Tax=Gilvimarinus sp. 1_MG-2023 TaxID=3062638 RepID=UPI0026E46CE8|nr:hypothetical protein [Gilvimarinus sp. 1_MG-2023]MDO6746282.1 hypothetical protein [Gilvimarinus sp. 1_MG-2023]